MANTDASQAQREDRGAMSFVPVLVALVTVGLFLGWLATRQPVADTVAVVEPGQTGAPQNAVAGTVTDPAELNVQGGRPLVGQDIELQSVPVTSAMGQHFAWIELPGGSPYLLRLDPALVAQGTPIPIGQRARIVGRVEEKPDALVASWAQEGLLQDEGHRMQAEFGVTYLMARLVEPAN